MHLDLYLECLEAHDNAVAAVHDKVLAVVPQQTVGHVTQQRLGPPSHLLRLQGRTATHLEGAEEAHVGFVYFGELGEGC